MSGQSLSDSPGEGTFQFIFSHCGTIRNENVDSFADFALLNCNLRQNEGAIPLSAVKAKVKRSMRDTEEQMYKKNDDGTASYLRKQLSIRGSNLKNINLGLSRTQEVVLARLRTGESPVLDFFRARLGMVPDTLCRCCREHEPYLR